MSRSARTGNGWWWDLTDAAGGRLEWRLVGALIATGTGRGPTPAGTGPALSRGVGPPTTMAVGISAWNLAGFGCRTHSGRPPGFPGGREPDTSAGRRCRRPRELDRAESWRFARPRLPHARLSSSASNGSWSLSDPQR